MQNDSPIPQNPSQGSTPTEIKVATKNLLDGYRLQLLLCQNPQTLTAWLCQLGDPGKELFLLHTPFSRWISEKPELDKPLGSTCAFCAQPISHYAGEWQERIHCGCTMLVLPLDLDFLVNVYQDAGQWAALIKTAQEGLTPS